MQYAKHGHYLLLYKALTTFGGLCMGILKIAMAPKLGVKAG